MTTIVYIQQKDIFMNVPGGSCEGVGRADDDNSTRDDILEDDASAFLSQSIADVADRDIYERFSLCPASDPGTAPAEPRGEVEPVSREITASNTPLVELTGSGLVTRPVRSSSPPARSSTSDDISTRERPMGGFSPSVGKLGRSVCYGKGPYGQRDWAGRVGGKSDFASKRRFFYVRWVGKG